MSTKVRKIDQKLERVLTIIEESSADMLNAAGDAIKLSKRIETATANLQAELQLAMQKAEQEETEPAFTQEDAANKYEVEIIPLHAKLENRLAKLIRNNKATANMLGALKALYEVDTKKDEV